MDETGWSYPPPALPPGVRPGEPPALHNLDEYVFQELCRDLFSEQPGIATCALYGKRGQSQHGIDLLAHRKDGNGIEVGQCKRYEHFSPAEIQRASDVFIEHLNTRWSKEKVRRFILFVACDLEDRKEQDEVCEQRRRFQGLGIAYEAWGAPMIRNKLGPHPGIVARYFVPAEHWMATICGVFPPGSTSAVYIRLDAPPVVQVALVSQLERLAARTAGNTERGLESMREAWREGRRDEAIAWVGNIKSDVDLWSILPRSLQAKILIFEAGLELDSTGALHRVKQLADDAQAIDPSQDQARIRALIALREHGPEAAIAILGDRDDMDSINLRAALLLEMGRIDECLALLDTENRGSDKDGNA